MIDNSYWYLSITPKEYEWIYRGTSALDLLYLFKRPPKDEIQWKGQYLNTKLWRLNNIYTIINKDGIKELFTMNRAQHIKYAASLRHPRVMVLKSRQRGISTFTLIDYNDDAMFYPNMSIGMQSYGLDESAVLLEKLTVLWENMPRVILDHTRLTKTKQNTKAVGYSNGSEVRVQTSFRGDTLQRLHVSELGKISARDPKKARELKTGTLQAIKAGNAVTIESTAEGQHNAFHEWWYNAVDLIGERSLKDFFPLFISWVEDPDCNLEMDTTISEEDIHELEVIEAEYREYLIDNGLDDEAEAFALTRTQKNWFVGQRRELGKDFYQEYPHTPEAAFNAVQDGAYYARLWRQKGTVIHVNIEKAGTKLGNILYTSKDLYDDNLDTYVAMDLGMNDMMVMVYFQIFGNEFRIVDEYHNHGEGLEHYVEELKKSGYRIKTVILPHDAKVTELGTGKSRLGRLRELGVRNCKVLKRTPSIITDIEQVRKAIPFMSISALKADYIIKMMGRYMKKWDETLGTFAAKPLHNEWSNPADAVRYGVLSGIWAFLDETKRAEPRRRRKPRKGMSL